MCTNVLSKTRDGCENDSFKSNPVNALLTATTGLCLLNYYALTQGETFLPNAYILIVTDLEPRGNNNSRFFPIYTWITLLQKWHS